METLTFIWVFYFYFPLKKREIWLSFDVIVDWCFSRAHTVKFMFWTSEVFVIPNYEMTFSFVSSARVDDFGLNGKLESTIKLYLTSWDDCGQSDASFRVIWDVDVIFLSISFFYKPNLNFFFLCSKIPSQIPNVSLKFNGFTHT